MKDKKYYEDKANKILDMMRGNGWFSINDIREKYKELYPDESINDVTSIVLRLTKDKNIESERRYKFRFKRVNKDD